MAFLRQMCMITKNFEIVFTAGTLDQRACTYIRYGHITEPWQLFVDTFNYQILIHILSFNHELRYLRLAHLSIQVSREHVKLVPAYLRALAIQWVLTGAGIPLDDHTFRYKLIDLQFWLNLRYNQ